jgi:hypothetical protein
LRIRAIGRPDVAHPKAREFGNIQPPGQAARVTNACDYGDLSRLALEADLGVDELRARLARMSDGSLLEFARAAAYLCTPYANLDSVCENRSSGN